MTRPEPVLILDTFKALVAVAVTFGWVKLDDTQQALILTLAGAVITLVLSILTRAHVTPVADPDVPVVWAGAGEDPGRHALRDTE